MSEKLQEAITATRAGQKREAQFLLTEILQEDPNDEYAWFLLGNLVDSPEKRMAYLGKALTINPHNEKARQQLNHIQRQTMIAPESEAEPVVVMVKEDEATAVVEDIAELPDWLAEQPDDDLADGATTDDEIPETMEATFDEEEAVEAKMELAKATAATPIPTVKKDDREQQLKRYNQMLVFLVILIILTLIILIWTL